MRICSPIVVCVYIFCSFFLSVFWQHGPYLFCLLLTILLFRFSIYIIWEKFNAFYMWSALVLKIVFKLYEFNCAIALLVNGNGFLFSISCYLLRVQLEIYKKFNFHNEIWSSVSAAEVTYRPTENWLLITHIFHDDNTHLPI